MFGNLMGCGCDRMDGIKEPTAFVTVRKEEIKGSNIIIPYNCVTLKRQDHEMSFGIPWNQQQPHGRKNSSYDGGQYKQKDMNKERFEQKAAYYKPINGPKCSQCKKRFKPEKLHSHMKSCKGVKTSVKVDNQHVESTVPYNIHLEKPIHKTFNIE